jgi:hypothetical protein
MGRSEASHENARLAACLPAASKSRAPWLDFGGDAPTVRPRRSIQTARNLGSYFYRARLILFAALLFPQSLSRQRLFHPGFFSRFHVKAVPLDFLNDVFLLDLALETPQRILQGFTFLNCDFCQAVFTPIPWNGYEMQTDSL